MMENIFYIPCKFGTFNWATLKANNVDMTTWSWNEKDISACRICNTRTIWMIYAMKKAIRVKEMAVHGWPTALLNRQTDKDDLRTAASVDAEAKTWVVWWGNWQTTSQTFKEIFWPIFTQLWMDGGGVGSGCLQQGEKNCPLSFAI